MAYQPFRATVKRDDYTWEFEVGERILGVMADNDGTLEVASSWILGRPSLYAAGEYPYWKSNNRGFEGRVNDALGDPGGEPIAGLHRGLAPRGLSAGGHDD